MKGLLKMKGYTITAEKKIELISKEASLTPEDYAKVRLTKAGLNTFDIDMYSGKNKSCAFPIIPSRQGAGVISEVSEKNEKGLKKGDRVFINPYLPCKECFQCKTDNKNICSNMKIMGCDIDGFLLDFINVPIDNLIKLPDQVSDSDVLFAENISICLEILDSLKIEKGDYLAIVGGNTLGNILAQLTIYHQAVPILIDENDKNIKTAKLSGVYYTISKDDDAQKIINQITGGRLAKYVAYISGCGYDINKVADLCTEGGVLALWGYEKEQDLKLDLKNIVKRNLKILSFNNGSNQLQAALNILATKSIVVSNLVSETIKIDRIPEMFKYYSEVLDENDLFELVVDTLT